MSAFAFTLCADDYALSPAVSQGILECLAAGRLSATCAMTTRSYWPQAATLLAPYAGRAGLGVHLNLTLGAPLTLAPTLAPGGVLPPLRQLIGQARAGRLPPAELRAEIEAQLEAFAAAMGREPDFVDGHQHVQALPGVREALLDAMKARGLAGRAWLRDSADSPWRILRRGVEAKKALIVAILARGFAAQARAAGFAVNDGFAGFSAFDARRDFGADFARYLDAPGPRHLVMCHPGHVDDELASLDPVTQSRERELAFLLSPAFERTLAAAGATLTPSPVRA